MHKEFIDWYADRHRNWLSSSRSERLRGNPQRSSAVAAPSPRVLSTAAQDLDDDLYSDDLPPKPTEKKAMIEGVYQRRFLSTDGEFASLINVVANPRRPNADQVPDDVRADKDAKKLLKLARKRGKECSRVQEDNPAQSPQEPPKPKSGVHSERTEKPDQFGNPNGDATRGPKGNKASDLAGPNRGQATQDDINRLLMAEHNRLHRIG